MYAQHLLDRAYGLVPHHVLGRVVASRCVHALQPHAMNFGQHLPPPDDPHNRIASHSSGVNAITVDKFEGRYLLSGGADSSLAIWDLESRVTAGKTSDTILPLEATHKTSEEHKLGITQISFYPFDSLAFLTSSYDHTVKVYSSETLRPSAAFDLDSVVYNIALSPIASHLLVACATQNPNVRLVDLRSGANTHSLAGHSGVILSTAWSPVREHILVSGATDGSVRFWDIRRSVGELGTLDLEDSIGLSTNPSTFVSHHGTRAQAHRGPVNGIVWTDDGRHLVTCGHDDRIRVWSTDRGANTLANFGPWVKNSGLAPCVPVLPPTANFQTKSDVMLYPNEHELLVYELFEGKLLRRLRRPHEISNRLFATSETKGHRNAKDKITSLAWRAHHVELYSAHADGSIAAWKPRMEEDAYLDAEEEREHEDNENKRNRKRSVLDDIYQGLMKKQMTFGGLGS
ncbi:WD40 repeat-like protein [Plenodomus tracheiphilus IPT5]|uniref:WD40 repeat-like protein n=1 Tax=Plenodomus tracheiphilus IPT5 TaxID=1408161 RepID=A0A6A7BJK7_9PLEO|nr:WD40 repeat-like protein [Plenodomus tracheiphilus IPT5]